MDMPMGHSEPTPPDGSGCCVCGREGAHWSVCDEVTQRVHRTLCAPCAADLIGVPVDPVAAAEAWLGRLPALVRVAEAAALLEEMRSRLVAIRAAALREVHEQTGSWRRTGELVGITAARAANVAAGRRRRQPPGQGGADADRSRI